MGNSYSDKWLFDIKKKIDELKYLLINLDEKFNQIFKTILLRLDEIDSLNKKKYQEIYKFKKSKKNKIITENEIEKVNEQIEFFEKETDLKQKKKKLSKIKNLEKFNGQVVGKKRLFFKKGSPQYEEKKY